MHLSQLLSLTALGSVVSGITSKYLTSNTAQPSIKRLLRPELSNKCPPVSYDTGYDNKARSLTAVSCSDGEHGLITRKHWNTQGDIPTFPYIGGAQAVADWNSVNCGTCWRIDYKGRSINVLAIDHTDAGFNIAQGAMDALTNNQAVQLGRIEGQATQIDAKICGM
jgi:hypothetical protein